jgi:hypothetical protein
MRAIVFACVLLIRFTLSQSLIDTDGVRSIDERAVRDAKYSDNIYDPVRVSMRLPVYNM